LSYSILIVDDSPLIRHALRACLEENHKDWKVCGEAADGMAALEMARELKPDLIVLDLSMPGMNGFEHVQIETHESWGSAGHVYPP
jgi:two-component system, response regulator YesN